MNKTNLQRASDQLHHAKQTPQWLAEKIGVWNQVRLIRQTLGMTQSQLGARTGMCQSAVAKIENEKTDVQLSTLEKIAQALECEVVVRLVPKKEIAQLLDEKSEDVARKLLSISAANAAVELQKPDDKYIELHIQEKKEDILKHHRSKLWDTP